MANSCSLCGADLKLSGNFFTIQNAPQSAQYLPQKKSDCNGYPLNLIKCKYCGLFQLDSEPVSYWKEVIRASSISPEMLKFRYEQFDKIIREYDLKNKSVLEIGCGEGEHLDILNSLGMQAVGLENNKKSKISTKNFHREIIEGYITDKLDVDFEKFDFFICINFLEHAVKPLDFLRSIKDKLKPGVIGIIEVPDFEKDIVNNRSYNIIRDHLSYFDENTLNLALKLTGFNVLSIRKCWHEDDIEVVVEVAENKHRNKWNKPVSNQLALINFLKKNNNKRIAVWGASHQALTLLAMVGADNIICIADSAHFKQNRYDGVLGIKIVSPDKMIALDPDVVIVAAAGYSKEVINILNNKYKFNGIIKSIEDLST